MEGVVAIVTIIITIVVVMLLLLRRNRERYYANYAHYIDPKTGQPIEVDIAQHPLPEYLGAYPRWTEMSDAGAYPDLVVPSLLY